MLKAKSPLRNDLDGLDNLTDRTKLVLALMYKARYWHGFAAGVLTLAVPWTAVIMYQLWIS